MRNILIAATAALSVAGLSALADTPAKSADVQKDSSGQAQQSAQTATGEHKIHLPDQMSWAPAPNMLPPGAMISVLYGDPGATSGNFVARLKVPAGYHVPPHSHPTDENLTVVSGSMLYGVGDQADKAKAAELPVGTYVFLPGNHPHTVWAGDQGFVLEIQAQGPFDITYVNPGDDPRKEMAQTAK
jgi:quercetin dioxygenase-like cupin family protein